MKTLIFLILLSTSFYNFAIAQISDDVYFNELNNQVCGTSDQVPVVTFPRFPVDNDTLRILVVFARYPDDTWDPPPPNHATQYWPNSLGTNKPTWATSIIKQNTQNIGTTNMTAFFRDASLNKLFVIGDVYPDLYIFKNNSSYYSSNGREIGSAVKELLENIDDNVDYSLYDKFAPNDPINKRHPDGQVDFIFIIFRFFLDTEPQTGSGVAALGGTAETFENGIDSINLDGVGITAYSCFGNGSGAISTQRTPWTYNTNCHELGHYIWGGHRNYLGLFNIMNTNGNSFPSSDEREFLNWSTATYTPTSNSTIILQDYSTTGQFIKINRGSNTFYLENRRRLNYHFSHDWKQWYNFEFQPNTPLVPDSLLLIHRGGGTLKSVEAADGRWNFLKSSPYPTRYVIDTLNNGIYMDRFIYDTPNRFLGETIFDLRGKLGVSYHTGQLLNAPRTDRSVGGDTLSCFDIGYNQVFSPWSNPGIKVNNPSDSLAVEILGKTTDGNLIISVYFDNLTQSSPSKPQYLHVTRQFIGTPLNPFYPRLNWNRNLEPDLSHYKIYKGEVSTPGQDPSNYYYIGTTSDTTYLDQSLVLYKGGSGGPCPNIPITYSYRISSVDLTNKESCRSERDSIWGFIDPCTAEAAGDNIPSETESNISENKLNQNYPNPFNPITKISYSIKEQSFVKIKIYDISGRELISLVNEMKNPGDYFVNFDGSNMASGIYYYKIIAGNFVAIRKMLLIK